MKRGKRKEARKIYLGEQTSAPRFLSLDRVSPGNFLRDTFRAIFQAGRRRHTFVRHDSQGLRALPTGFLRAAVLSLRARDKTLPVYYARAHRRRVTRAGGGGAAALAIASVFIARSDRASARGNVAAVATGLYRAPPRR